MKPCPLCGLNAGAHPVVSLRAKAPYFTVLPSVSFWSLSFPSLGAEPYQPLCGAAISISPDGSKTRGLPPALCWWRRHPPMQTTSTFAAIVVRRGRQCRLSPALLPRRPGESGRVILVQGNMAFAVPNRNALVSGHCAAEWRLTALRQCPLGGLNENSGGEWGLASSTFLFWKPEGSSAIKPIIKPSHMCSVQ